MLVVADHRGVQVAEAVYLRRAQEGDGVQAPVPDVAEGFHQAGVEVAEGHDPRVGHGHGQLVELRPDTARLEEHVGPGGVDALGHGSRQHGHAGAREQHVAVVDEAAGGDGHHLARRAGAPLRGRPPAPRPLRRALAHGVTSGPVRARSPPRYWPDARQLRTAHLVQVCVAVVHAVDPLLQVGLPSSSSRTTCLVEVQVRGVVVVEEGQAVGWAPKGTGTTASTRNGGRAFWSGSRRR